MSFEVTQAGVMSLLQDAGRYGQHGLGLTTGGPADAHAYVLCQRLLNNDHNATAVEISFGGLELLALNDAQIAVTGANTDLFIDEQPADLWRTHALKKGQRLRFGYATRGCRSYLGVRGGFTVTPQFNSTATVLREGIGGLNGGKLQVGDQLPFAPCRITQDVFIAPNDQPNYPEHVDLRLISGYQFELFTAHERARFFSSIYTITDRADRMGYCLQGAPIACTINTLLSEGICLGAVQIPADGQPIVLLNDRQTIGGYPKIGAVLSLDVAKLCQLRPGNTVSFTAISPEQAHNALHLANAHLQGIAIKELP
ncbi:MAG: allophanate hydrolase [Gammaproteobacteria bacterium]|nr:MAG: allophanate hydrolase [Gammaproteobacteria bacterium]